MNDKHFCQMLVGTEDMTVQPVQCDNHDTSKLCGIMSDCFNTIVPEADNRAAQSVRVCM